MRLTSVRASLLVAALPLVAASCSSTPPPDPGKPVRAQLSDAQADYLGRQYLNSQSVSAPRMLVAEEKQGRGWWLRYKGPFDAAGKPPQASYLVQVDNDGTVREIE